jgi:tetratricopeptide (TPR) repeat protein
MILISTAILGLALLMPQQGPDPRAEAERLANSGSYDAALRQFQAIAAANPDDIEARMWIARLYAKLGHPEHAAEVYRSILATQPQNLDALLGLGNALVTIGRLHEASEALTQAEKIAGDKPEVLAAQGRLHATANRTTLALAYYTRALALDPGNKEVRVQADALRAARAHRLELDYDFQHTNEDLDDSHVGTFALNARLSDSVRIVGEGQAERLFGVDDQRAGVGFEFALSRNTRLSVGGLGGFDPVYLPESDFYGDLTFDGRHASVGVLVRRAGFQDSDFWIAGPEFTVKLSKSADASLAYYHGNATQVGLPDAGTDTVAIRLGGWVAKQFRLGAGYTHGIDRLDWLTADRIAVESDTFALRGTFAFTPFVSFEVGYDFQSRPADVQVHRARAGLVYRF